MITILSSNPSDVLWPMLWPLRFLQASVSSVLLGLILWAALRAAASRWPVLTFQRAVWLAAQLTTAAVFALTLAPQSARLGILPVLSAATVTAKTRASAADAAPARPESAAALAYTATPEARAVSTVTAEDAQAIGTVPTPDVQ